MKEHTIFIAAGGTGGHISPGVALAETFYASKNKVVFFTLEKNRSYPDILRLEQDKIAQVVYYPAPRIPKNPLKVVSFYREFALCRRYIQQAVAANPPDAIIGMGGFPSFPLVWYARRNRIPYFLCEQNAKHGLITRLMCAKAKQVFLAFSKDDYEKNEVLTGTPLRKAFREQSPNRNPVKGIARILIVGGSQGAANLNALYSAMIKDSFFEKSEITLSTGKLQAHEIQARARPQDRVFEFIEKMHEELPRADLVISRSGSGTLFEILWAGRAAVLLPFAYAADNHQRANADLLKANGLAEIIDIRPFDADEALRQLKAICQQDKLYPIQQKAASTNLLPLNAHETIYQKINYTLETLV